MNRVPHWTGGLQSEDAMQIEALTFFGSFGDQPPPPCKETVRERLHHHEPLGIPCPYPFIPKTRCLLRSGLSGLPIITGTPFTRGGGGDVSSPCILFYNPQRWDFIAQQCVCLWHSPKQDLLPPRQMWLESIMPCKHTLSEQPLGSLQDFSFFFPASFNVWLMSENLIIIEC